MPLTSLDVLGQQLRDFLTAQFQSPTGSRTVLGFLPAGIGVDPLSFYEAGTPNPMLIQQWLGIVADPLAEIADGTATNAQARASTVMQAIAIFATPTTPIGSDAANVIGRLKSLASAATTPASDVVEAAPLDWYDPSTVPSWPSHTMSATAPPPPTDPGSGQPPPQTPIDLPPIWNWRHLRIASRDPADVSDGGPIGKRIGILPRRIDQPTLTSMSRSSTMLPGLHAEPLIETASQFETAPESVDVHLAVEQYQQQDPVAAAAVSSDAAGVADAAPAVASLQQADIGTVQESATAVLLDRNWFGAQAQVAGTADTTPVAAPNLTLSLRYRFIQLGRSAWWSDLLVAAPNWCFPGQRAGSLVPGTLPADATVGMPVALILTDEVSVHGTWTDADKAAVADSSHFGPWQLSGVGPSSGDDSLQIPGMQVIAMIYQLLQSLPPADDPQLPPHDPAPPSTDDASGPTPPPAPPAAQDPTVPAADAGSGMTPSPPPPQQTSTP
jgi:hypothetical protein